MQPLERLLEPLVVPGQATESGHPAIRPLHDPAPGQEDESPLRLGQADDLPLLVDHLPGREVLGKLAPGRATSEDPPQAIEDIPEVTDALADVLGQEAEVGRDELPFGVGDVAGIGLMSDHTLNEVAYCTKVHNTL